MKTDLFSVTIRCTGDEIDSLQKAWKHSECNNRSQFIKMAVNSYALENNYSEDVIFKKIKVV